MKIKKILLPILLGIAILLPTNCFAEEVGWPVDVEATENVVTPETEVTETVTPEVIPETVPEVSDTNVQPDAEVTTDATTVNEQTPTTPTAETLGAIDNNTTELQDEQIFGEEYELVNRLSSGSTPGDEADMSAKIYSNYSDVVPVVTTDQMVEWILKKGNELISILQIFAQPFAIIIFIVSCAIALVGSLTKGNMAGKGMIGMVASAVLYACCLYAPIIVNSITSWVAS